LAKKELMNRQIEQSEKNNAATNLQRVYKGHLGRREATTEKFRNAFKEFAPSVSGDTTLSQLTTPAFSTPAFSRSPSVVGGIGKVRKERSDKGVARGPYKQKRPVGRPRKNPIKDIVVEREDYEPPAARTERGTGLRGRHYHPKKRVVHTTKEQQLKNRLFLITKEIKAGNDNAKLIAEADKLYTELYDIDNAHLLLKK